MRVVVTLMALVVLTCVAVVYSSFAVRQRIFVLDQLEKENAQLDVNWGRLLIQKNTMVSHASLERKAIQLFGMGYPSEEQIVIIPHGTRHE